MNWIFEHENEEESGNVQQEQVQLLMDAGFSKAHAQEALRATGGDVERAFDWILSHPEGDKESSPADTLPKPALYKLASFISHKGPSVHCGHYIAHVRHHPSGEWIMFNDDRVVRADPQPPTIAAEQAYIYVFTRTA